MEKCSPDLPIGSPPHHHHHPHLDVLVGAVDESSFGDQRGGPQETQLHDSPQGFARQHFAKKNLIDFSLPAELSDKWTDGRDNMWGWTG